MSTKNKIDKNSVAVMIELVQGEGGVKAFDKKELQALNKYLKEKGVLFVIDEIQTGIYRTGEFLASNYFELKPDIITMAKGLAGGMKFKSDTTCKYETIKEDAKDLLEEAKVKNEG